MIHVMSSVSTFIYLFITIKRQKKRKRKKEEIIFAKSVHTDFFLFFLQESFKYDLKHKYFFAFVS